MMVQTPRYPLDAIATPSRSQLDACIVGRTDSLFTADIAASGQKIADALREMRVLVVGGAGSIGSATVRQLITYEPKVLHIIDHSENYLVELTRDLRNGAVSSSSSELRFWPIDYGSSIARQLLFDQEPYDVVLNFAALKHVRSEKDVFSLLQMISTNVVRQASFKRWVMARGCSKYFGVSTDKAANPVSLMGATKRLMEDVLFDAAPTASCTTTSARFANVAYSNGSLLQAWQRRLAAGQPLAVPCNTRRYFVTEAEAGELCLLAALLAQDQTIVIPRLNFQNELHLLEDLAVRFLQLHGLRPEFFAAETDARQHLRDLHANRSWPLLLTPADTSGEKPFEEFIGAGEEAVNIGFGALLGIKHIRSAGFNNHVLVKLEQMISNPGPTTTRAEVISLLSSVIPTFRHAASEKSLDDRA